MKVESTVTPAASLSVTLLPQEVPGSIPGYVMGLFSGGELFHGMYGLGVSVFQCHLFMLCLRKRPVHSPDHSIVR